MGDAEGVFTGERSPPAEVSQAVAVSNSPISNSHVHITNNHHYQVFYVQGRPSAWGEPFTNQQRESGGQEPEVSGQRPEGTVQQPEGTGEETAQPEEDQVNSDSDEHKELSNSWCFIGNHGRQRTDTIQAATLEGRFPGEVPMPSLERQLVQGRPMPANCSCKITPHSCEVRPSMLLKLSRQLFPAFFQEECAMVCLVQNMVCVSKSNRKHIIQNVVDTVKKPLQLNGHDLAVGNLVVTLPESEIFKWQTVIDEDLRRPQQCKTTDDPSLLFAN